MAEPFSKIERGLARARVRQTEWQQWLAHARPDSPQATLARGKVEFLDLYIAAEVALLTYLRRQWSLYAHFQLVDKPADLQRWFLLWTDAEKKQ